MRVGTYARTSTSDRDQNPETQLVPLREFVAARGWTLVGEFVDKVSATDLRGRTQWRGLLDAASKRKIDLVLVWKLDRAFRSVLHASTTLAELRRWGVGLRSYTEPWADTTSAQGELVFNLLTTFAQFERSLIGERMKAGMARAKKQGTFVGRPQALKRAEVAQDVGQPCFVSRGVRGLGIDTLREECQGFLLVHEQLH